MTEAQFEFIEERLMRLESQLAFQEDTIRQLNQVIYSQQQEIFQLQRQFKQKKEEEQNPIDARMIQDLLRHEKPPHY